MQYLLLFLALAVCAVVVVLLVGPRRGRRRGPSAAARSEDGAGIVGLAEPEPVLPPVLLPEHPRGADVDAVRLSVGVRGYRCDQVDALLDTLAAEVERLHARLEERESEAPPAG